MANSHNHHRSKEIFHFWRKYLVVSVIATLVLTFVTYKDIIYLRFGTDFYGDPNTQTPGVKQLLFDGSAGNALHHFSASLPLLIVVSASLMIAYSLVNTYKRTYDSLNISKHYVNAHRVPTTNIILMYVAVRSAAFTLPLLYWCFYLAVWFPFLVKIPLRYLTSPSLTPVILSSLGVVVCLSLLTHLGITISRLAVKTFKVI